MLGTYTRNHQYMFAAMFLWGFGMGMFIFIQPLFIESLGATTAQVGFALAAGGLTVTALYIPIGMWADRRGRRITILAGWWLASFATILMAVAPDWRWLIPGLIMYQLANFAMPAFNEERLDKNKHTHAKPPQEHGSKHVLVIAGVGA